MGGVLTPPGSLKKLTLESVDALVGLEAVPLAVPPVTALAPTGPELILEVTFPVTVLEGAAAGATVTGADTVAPAAVALGVSFWGVH
jgi:hypothetical protein